MCCGLFSRLRKRKDNKIKADVDEMKEEETKKHEYAVQYSDLEGLLGEFGDAQTTLKK